MDNDFATGYALGADSGGSNCNGGWGGNGFGDWLVVLLLFVLMGGGFWGGNGWGGSGGSGLQGMATRADINEGFALDNITSGIRSIQQGICDSTYALNNGINNGFSSSLRAAAARTGRPSRRCATTWRLRHAIPAT